MAFEPKRGVKIMCAVRQEKMWVWLLSIKLAMVKRSNRLKGGWTVENIIKMFNMGSEVTKPFEYLLATGNLSSKTGQRRLPPSVFPQQPGNGTWAGRGSNLRSNEAFKTGARFKSNTAM